MACKAEASDAEAFRSRVRIRALRDSERNSSDFQREDFDIYTESSVGVFDAILGTSIKARLGTREGRERTKLRQSKSLGQSRSLGLTLGVSAEMLLVRRGWPVHSQVKTIDGDAEIKVPKGRTCSKFVWKAPRVFSSCEVRSLRRVFESEAEVCQSSANLRTEQTDVAPSLQRFTCRGWRRSD